MPSAVSPKRFMMRSESEPWLVPMRSARPSSLQRRTSGRKRAGRALHLFAPLGVAVLAHRELLLVGEVARVDAHLLDVLGGDQRGVRREVDVGDQRHADAAPPQLAADLREVLGLLERGRGDARDLAAGLHHALDLRDGRVRVERVGRRHRLHAHGVRAADADVADADFEGAAGGAARRRS